VGTHDSEGLAVERKLLCLGRVGLKIRDLATAGAIERVQPQVVRALFSDDVHDGFSVGRELRVTPDTGIGIKKLHLRLGPGTKRDQDKFPYGHFGIVARREKY